MNQDDCQEKKSIKWDRKQKSAVIAWISGAGCTIQFLQKEKTINNLNSTMITEEDAEESPHMRSNNHRGELFGIRCDWDVPLLGSSGLDLEQELWDQMQVWQFHQEDLKVHSNFRKKRKAKKKRKSPRNLNERIRYINEWLLQFQAIYPNDVWKIYTPRKERYEKDKRIDNTLVSDEQKPHSPTKAQIAVRFSPEQFGYMFISHAHTDHSPVEAESPLIHTWREDGRWGPIYPFPVTCTGLTKALIQQRFNRDVITVRDWPESPIPKEMQSAWQNLIHLLKLWKDNYIIGLKTEFQRKCMDDDYFTPHWMPWGCWWFIPNGHIVGSASVCVLTLESLVSEYGMIRQTTITTPSAADLQVQNYVKPLLPYADVIYIGEANTCVHPHILPLPPVKANAIIIEDLFADPRWEFPNQDTERDRLKQWINETIHTHSIVVICHDLGKSQLIWMLLEQLNQESVNSNIKIPLIMPMSMYRVFKTIQTQLHIGPEMGTTWIWNKTDARKQHISRNAKVILLATPNERNTPTLQNWIDHNHAKIVEITGWCQNALYRQNHPADAYFSITDHFTYEAMSSWLKNSQIQTIWFVGNPTQLEREEDIDEGKSKNANSLTEIMSEKLETENFTNQTTQTENILTSLNKHDQSELEEKTGISIDEEECDFDQIETMTSMLAFRLQKMGWEVRFLSSWEELFFGVQKSS